MRARPKIRVETDPTRVLAFMAGNGYTLPWTEEILRNYCITVRIEQNNEVCAYVWASWVTDGVLDFHACSSRRLWLDTDTLHRLYDIAELFGAHTLQVTPVGPNPSVVRRLLASRGFSAAGDTLTKRLDEPTNGPVQRSFDTERADPGTATATSDTGTS